VRKPGARPIILTRWLHASCHKRSVATAEKRMIDINRGIGDLAGKRAGMRNRDL